MRGEPDAVWQSVAAHILEHDSSRQIAADLLRSLNDSRCGGVLWANALSLLSFILADKYVNHSCIPCKVTQCIVWWILQFVLMVISATRNSAFAVSMGAVTSVEQVPSVYCVHESSTCCT